MTLNEAIAHCEEKAAELGCTPGGQEHAWLAEQLKELKRLRAENERLKKERGTLKERIEDLEDENGELRDDVRYLKNKIAKLKKEVVQSED